MPTLTQSKEAPPEKQDPSLKRLEEQSERLLGPPPIPDEADDPIEKLGLRIARILGPLIAIGLIIYLYATYSA